MSMPSQPPNWTPPPPAEDALVTLGRWLRTRPAQAVVLWAGGLLAAWLALVPPWYVYEPGRTTQGRYSPIFMPPNGTAHIETTRWIVPIAVVLGLTGIGYVTARPRPPAA
jgi:hypothetical protein